MRPTQANQIKNAKRAYILALSDSRFAVYLDGGNGLDVLWPSDTHETKSKELLPAQIYSKNNKYPAYHFRITGYGFSKQNEIRETLTAINPAIEVATLNGGWSPSFSF